MLRFTLLIGLLWVLMSGFTELIPRSGGAEEAFAWRQLSIGTSEDDVQTFVNEHNPQLVFNTIHQFQGCSEDNTQLALNIHRGQLSHITLDSSLSACPPLAGEVILALGSPQFIRTEACSVSNVRRLTVHLLYQNGDEITVVTITRLTSFPAEFGAFRLRADDPVQRISRYVGRADSLKMTDGWWGWASYPILQWCR